MTAFLLDLAALLLAALLAAGAGGWLLSRTPLGVVWRQTRNRRRIEQRRTCARHGVHAEHELVRLPSGETLCPQCYEEIYHVDLG